MKLIICGDIVPTAATTPVFEAGDCEALMGAALPLLREADFTVANLECALSDIGTPIEKCGPNLRGKAAFAKVLADCGFTHLSLSNNHVMDFGIPAMRDTAKNIEENGIIPFGFGEDDQDSRKITYIEKDGKKVALLGVCEHEYSYALPHRFGANPFDPFDTMEDISVAKQNADFVVVMYHGGKEQCEVPSPRLRKACRAMVRAGADLILCQHSHCIGCMENYRGGEIVYGTGNFNFAKYSDHPHWHSGLMTVVDFAEETDISYLPVVVNDTGITLAKGSEKEEILSGFLKRSEMIEDEALWMEAWKKFCLSVEENYRKAASDSEKQVFPHYLDCEAHLDVWHTLFETWHRTGKTME